MWYQHIIVPVSDPGKVWVRVRVLFTLSLLRLRILHDRHEGSGDSSVVRAPDSWSKGPGFEFSQERREDFLLQGQLFLLTRISVSVLPPCYCSSTQTILVIRSAKSAGGRLQANTQHAPYLCRLESSDIVNCCMVCTEFALRDGRSFTWHQPCNGHWNSTVSLYTTSVDIKKERKKRATKWIQSFIQNRARVRVTWARWVCYWESSEAGLLEWMRFVIFRTRSRDWEVRALPGRFLSRRCFTLCITVEPRIAKQYKRQYCCSCKNYRGKGMEGGKKSVCIVFWLTRRSRVA